MPTTSLHRPLVTTLLSLLTAMAAVMPAAAIDAVPAETFAKLPHMSGAQLSPDGEHLAFFAYVDGRRQLVVSDLEGRARPIAAPPVEYLDFDWLHWANDERLVFSMTYFAPFSTLFGSTETRLLSIRKDGTGLTPLVRAVLDDEEGWFDPLELEVAQRQDDVIDWLPGDPGHILLALDADFDNRIEVRRIDVDNGDYEIVTDGWAGIEHWVTDATGTLRFGRGHRAGRPIFRLRDRNGNWTGGGAGQRRWGNFTPVAFTQDPSVAYVQGRNDAGRSVIRTLDLEKGEFLGTVFEHETADAEDIVFDPATRQAVGVTYVEHEARVDYFDESMQFLQR